MGSKIFKEETIAISGSDVEPTLRYLSPIVGIPFESVMDKKGKITKYGLEDSTVGSAGKTNVGTFGKKDSIGDIDIVIDEDRYSSDKLISRLVRKLGPENIGKPTNGGMAIPAKVRIGGNDTANLVEVNFILGKHDLISFTHHAPDPENLSEYDGTARNEMIGAILKDSRRQVRDADTKEINALIGPTYFLDKGFVQEWRHFPLKGDGSGRLKSNRPISRQEFSELYPDHIGKEKEMIINKPQEMIEYLFPKSKVKVENLDSYESLRDLVIEHKPERAEAIFNQFVQSMQRKGYSVPEGLIVENRQRILKSNLLTEVRQVSMNRVMESVARRGQFEDFRKKCLESLPTTKQLDHFIKPKATADLLPNEGLVHLIGKCGLMNEWHDLNKKDYGTNYHHRVNDYYNFYEDLCELIGEDNFFFVAEHYGLKITPDSFLNSLIEMEYEG